MAGELFKAMSGTNIVHVPHKASGEARNSVIGDLKEHAGDDVIRRLTAYVDGTPVTGDPAPWLAGSDVVLVSDPAPVGLGEKKRASPGARDVDCGQACF